MDGLWAVVRKNQEISWWNGPCTFVQEWADVIIGSVNGVWRRISSVNVEIMFYKTNDDWYRWSLLGCEVEGGGAGQHIISEAGQ